MIRSILIFSGLVVACVCGFLITAYPRVRNLVFVALGAAAVVLAISRRPDRGLLLSIFLFAVQKSPALPVVGVLLTYSEIVFVLTLLVWIVQSTKQQRRARLYAPGLLGPFLLYTLVVVVSLLTTFVQADIKVGVAEIFARVYLMFFLVVVASYTTTADHYCRVLLAWVASAMLVVGLAGLFLLFRQIGYDPIGLAQDVVLFKGLFQFSTGLAGFVSGTFLGFLPLALTPQPVTTFRRVQVIARWCLPGLLLALLLANSQGAYLAIIAGVLAWLLIRQTKSAGPILVILVIVVSGVALLSVLEFQMPNSFLARALSAIGYDIGRLPKRMALIETRFQMISSRPIMGVGIGQAARYTDHLAGRGKGIGSHFTPVGIIAETGVLGLLAVSIIMAAFLKIMWADATLDLDRGSGWLQLYEGLTMAFIGIYVFGLAHDIMTNRTLWLVLALTVGLKPAFLATTLCSQETDQRDQTPWADTGGNQRKEIPLLF